MTETSPHWISLAIMAVIIPLVLFLRFRSMSKVRPFKPQWLWVVPALYAVFAGFIYYYFPPHGLGWLYALFGLLAGAALGWWRGKLTHIMLDPQTRTLSQKASPAAMIFIVVLIIARVGSRSLLAQPGGSLMHGSAMLVTDVLVAFAIGFLAVQRLELYLRSRRLLTVATDSAAQVSGAGQA